MHILLVDCDVAKAHSMEQFLSGKRYRVTRCTGGLKALEVLRSELVDLVIMDAFLPDISGLEVCRHLRAEGASPAAPVLFVSARASTDDRIAGLEAGGDDYLSDLFDLRELGLRVEALLRRSQEARRSTVQADVAAAGMKLHTSTYSVEVNGREVQLTPVEFELLRYLMLRAGQVVPAERLLQDIWRYYPGTGDPAVVRVQIMNLRYKLERDRARPSYIKTVYGHGYMVPIHGTSFAQLVAS